MSEIVCYIERAAGGTAVRRVRLLAPGFDRSWNAPESSLTGSGGGAGGSAAPTITLGAPGGGSASGTGPALTAARAAARWIIDALGGLGSRRLAYLCVDTDGGLCTWLSAPSPDSDVISAAIAASVQRAAEGQGAGSGTLLAVGAGGGAGMAVGDVSLQALALSEGSGRSRGLLSSKESKATALLERRQRFAVLSVPDGVVKVVLDELDNAGIDVESVISLWHAMALAWDPGAAETIGLPLQERVVASDSPASAIVLLDPLGRMVWAWARAGELVAGGSMRLKTLSRSRPAEGQVTALTSEPVGGGSAARIGGTASFEEDGADDTVLECTGAEAGRLVMDWLAWSAQLGQSPERVVCLGPATAIPPASPQAESAPGAITPLAPAEWTPATLGEGLGRAWPGATIDVAVHDDPIGATLARLGGATGSGAGFRSSNARAGGTAGGARGGTIGGGSDPRLALLSLSARPGRADRTLRNWIALGITGAALAVAAFGYQLQRAAGTADSAIEEARTKRTEAIASLEPLIMNISKAPNPDDLIVTKTTEARDQSKSLRPQRPILSELLRVITALEGTKDATVMEISFNSAQGTTKLKVLDNETGPEFLERLLALPGAIRWQGSIPRTPDRQYHINGSWPLDAVRPGSPPPASPAANGGKH